MHKNGGMYTTWYTRLKIGHIWQKMFFVNFAHFSQNNEMLRIMMLYIIFVIFTKNVSFFSGGGPRGKFGELHKILKPYVFYHSLSFVSHFIPVKKRMICFLGVVSQNILCMICLLFTGYLHLYYF